MYNAGQLRELIEIERPVDIGIDPAGNRRVQWINEYTLYAAAHDVGTREFWEAAAHQLEHTITLTVRYLEGVTADMRVRWRGEIYDIVQVNHLRYRGDWMNIKVQRVESEARKHGKP